MKVGGLLSLWVALVVSCASALAGTTYEKVVTSPWKENEVYLSVEAKAQTITLSHVSQRTKVHSVTINDNELVYTFEGDRSIPDNRGQIRSGRRPVTIDLGRVRYIESVQIVSEGWNRPENGNKYRIRLSDSGGSTPGGSGNEALRFTGRWLNSVLETQSFTSTNVKTIELRVSDRTEIHKMRLILQGGFRYDVLNSTDLFRRPFINSNYTVKLNSGMQAEGIEIEAESQSSVRGQETTIHVLINGKGVITEPLPQTCSSGGRTYSEGETWQVTERESVKPLTCEFGGDKVEVSDVIQPMVCRAGRALRDGGSFERFKTTRGTCNARPAGRSCREDGVRYADGETWSRALNERERAADCPHGGNRVDIYKVFQPRVCAGGRATNNGASFDQYHTSRGVCNDAPVQLHCLTRRGVRKENGETWTTTPRNEEYTEAVTCEHGGNRENVYKLKIRRLCSRGNIVKLEETKGSFIESRGRCNPAPKRSCDGTGHGGVIWKRVRNSRERVPDACPFGGDKVSIYIQERELRCNDGDFKRTGNTRRTFLKSEGTCSAGRACNNGRRQHGATWTKATGRTKTEKRACGRGGKQDVVFEIIKGKRCNNGSVENTGDSKKRVSAGTCIEPPVMCPATPVLPSGRIDTSNNCDRESLPCQQLPRSSVGTRIGGTCGGGRDEDPRPYTVTCTASGAWSSVGGCQGGGSQNER